MNDKLERIGDYPFDRLRALLNPVTPRVNDPISLIKHSSTSRRVALTPALCPAVRGRKRFFAQRPLPSMTTATCLGNVLFVLLSCAVISKVPVRNQIH